MNDKDWKAACLELERINGNLVRSVLDLTRKLSEASAVIERLTEKLNERSRE